MSTLHRVGCPCTTTEKKNVSADSFRVIGDLAVFSETRVVARQCQASGHGGTWQRGGGQRWRERARRQMDKVMTLTDNAPMRTSAMRRSSAIVPWRCTVCGWEPLFGLGGLCPRCRRFFCIFHLHGWRFWQVAKGCTLCRVPKQSDTRQRAW
jgi:hypothetical protein